LKLTLKLTLAFLLVSLIAIGLAAVLIWGTTAFEFNRYLQNQRRATFAEVARGYYQNNQTWAGVERALQQQGLLPPPMKLGGQPPAPPPFALVDQNREVVIPSGIYGRGTKVQEEVLLKGIQIQVNGVVVGTVLDTGQPLVKNTVEQRYVDGVNQALWIAALSGIWLSLLLGTWLARTLTRPVNELTTATRSMASGKLEQQVPVRSQDELGELAAAFNQMSADLARANQARRQMTADIAHDLRNPLTVIGGYLESLQDGKLKPTPERFETMSNEVQHLQRLVEDLRTLSLADSGELALHRQPVFPGDLLERVAAAYRHQAAGQGIQLLVETEPDLPESALDPERMEQVLGNLISNALRYTPEGGEIRLTARQLAGRLVLSVADTGSGIPPESLPQIFERSYRGDASRTGNESGLGLAIAKSIIELHGGRISAQSDGPGKGTQILIEF
jgi:two-component system sensor histidine kinase BaeS